MKIQTVQKTEYSFDEKDATTIKACLDYCFHRINKHAKPIADFNEVQRLRREFGIIKSAEENPHNICAHNICEGICSMCQGQGCSDCIR